MLFLVVPMRVRGRALPVRDLVNRAGVTGDLRIEQWQDEALRRYVRVARVLDRSRPRDPEQLPPLYDATLLAMSPQAFTLTGFERVEGIEFAQSWLVRSA